MIEERYIESKINKDIESFNRINLEVLDNLDKLSACGGTYTLARLLSRRFYVLHNYNKLDEATKQKYTMIINEIESKLNKIKHNMAERDYYQQIYNELQESCQVYINWVEDYLFSEIYEEYLDSLNYRDTIYILQKYLENKRNISELMNQVAIKDEILKVNAKKLIEKGEFPALENRPKIVNYLPEDFWWWRLEDFVEEEG